jgi:hypothetical protein
MTSKKTLCSESSKTAIDSKKLNKLKKDPADV